MSGKSSSSSEPWGWGENPLWLGQNQASAPFLPPLSPHTHIKGLAEGVVAAKDWVGDRDQGWAGPFLPRGKVLLSILFCLRREVW